LNFFIYNTIANTLAKGIDKGYRKGIASVVLLNKKEILRLADTPELFKISYTDVDKVALTNFKVEAFTVAGVMSYECEEKLKQLAVELQEGKHPLAKGEKDIKKIWADEAYNILADYVQIPDMPPPNYLNTNLRTAMQSSYHASQYIRLQDDSVRDLYPAYQYKTLADSRVREAHMKLHDMIWASNDPVWDKIWPPNGWNCRCYIKPLNQEEALNSNVQPMTPPEKVSDIAREGRIGKDFERNPGQIGSIWGKWLQSKLDGKVYETISNEIVHAGYRMPKWETVEPLLLKNASPEPEPVEFSKENFVKLFGELPGSVNTVLGEYKLADVFFQKLEERDQGNRRKILKYIKPTMEVPHMVFVDKDNGTLFVKAFKTDNAETIYAGILKQLNDEEIVISFYDKKNINNKVNEGKFLVYQSLFPASDNAWGLPKFTHDGGRVNYVKLVTFKDTSKDKAATQQVLKDANEIWGETYNHNGVTNSELHYIRYRVEGFELVKVNNSTPYDYSIIEYSRIDEFRKGVLIQDDLKLNLESIEA
jgi:SPP1 gp7 family putative phage head morphogenesis protein